MSEEGEEKRRTEGAKEGVGIHLRRVRLLPLHPSEDDVEQLDEVVL